MADPTIGQRISQESADGSLSLTSAPAVPAIPTPGTDLGSIAKAVAAVKQILDLREGRSGSVLDKLLTMRDLIANGVVGINLGSGTISGSSAVIAGGTVTGGGTTTVGYVDPRPILGTPPTPTALTVFAAFKNIVLTWQLTDYQNKSYVEIWRNTTNALGSATLIGNSTANIYTDASGALGATYWYWVRAVGYDASDNPITGAFNAVSGVSGALLQIGNTDLGPLVVEAANLAAGSVGSTNIQNNAITAVHLAANSIAVGTAAIQNGAIVNAMIGNLAVDDAKIANLSGAKINAGTVTADKIAANSLTASQIQANTIGVGQLNASLLNSDNVLTRGMTVRDNSGNVILAAGTNLDWSKIGGTGKPADNATVGATIGVNLGGQINTSNVSTYIASAAIGLAQINTASIGALSAFTANLGTITSGTITVDASGFVRGGQTAYNTGVGFFLGYSSGAYKFSIGNPAGSYMVWDGSNLMFNKPTFDSFTASLSAGDLSVGNTTGTIGYTLGPGYQFYGSRTVTPSGGRSPYSYIWIVNNAVGGAVQVSDGTTTSATVRISGSGDGAINYARAICFVSDANGRVTLATFNITAAHGSSGGLSSGGGGDAP